MLRRRFSETFFPISETQSLATSNNTATKFRQRNDAVFIKHKKGTTPCFQNHIFSSFETISAPNEATKKSELAGEIAKKAFFGKRQSPLKKEHE